jgi:DNA (cytosine-5)-methyltransferase 1
VIDAALVRPYLDDDAWRRTEGGLIVPRARRAGRKLRAVDVFAGCGGFSLGMHQAGLDVIAAVEWAPWAVMTYLTNLGSVDGCAICYVDDVDKQRFAKALEKQGESQHSKWIGSNNPDRDGSGCRAMVIGDASKVTGSLIQEALGAIKSSTPIDVVFGGPPCQGMSSSGKQNPADPRNNLVLEFVRIADELGAELFVMENVPPLVTQAKFRPLFNALVDRAHAAGFTVTANVLDAANYGVPQRRRRAFVVGARGEANARPFSFAMPTNWAFVAEPGGERTDFLVDEIEAPAPRSKKRRKRKERT